jgi:signal transduction histidine kinase
MILVSAFPRFWRSGTDDGTAPDGVGAALDRLGAMGLLQVDGSGSVTQISPWWGRVLGTPPRDRVGRPWWAVAAPECIDDVAARFRDGVRSGRGFSQDVCIANPAGGARWVVVRWVADGEGGGSWIGVGIDVTEQRRLDDEVRQTEKLEAVGRLAGGVAHDLNNLLSVILTNTHILLMDADLFDGETREMIEDVDRAGKGGKELVKRLTGFSRRQELRFETVDLGAAVAASAQSLRRQLPAGVSMDLTAPPDGPQVHADHAAIDQILQNLVANALTAVGESGRIHFTVDTVEAGHREDGAPGPEPGTYGRVQVADDGVGMDDTTLRRAFEPFFTTKTKGRSAGLGLATVLGLVRRHGGHVRVESRPGAGATFSVYFPTRPPV